MFKKSVLKPSDLSKYIEKPNLFWRAFSQQYKIMFRPLKYLLNHENIDDWFVTPQKTFNKLNDFINTPNEDIPSLLIIRGLSGSGKSTSVRVFFEKYTQNLSSDTIYIYIDTSVTSVSTNDLEKDLDSQIHASLINQFGFNFFTNVPDDDESDTANKKRLLQIIKNGKRIITVWDNIDQCTKNIQIACLQIAHHKLNWIDGQKIIIPVREYTFDIARRELPIAGYDYSVIRHFSPTISDILKCRIQMAKNGLDILDSDQLIDLEDGISVKVTDGNKFLEKVIDDICKSDTNKALTELSNGNINTQLIMVQYAFKSPHLNRKTILDSLASYYNKDTNFILIPHYGFIEGVLTCALDECYTYYSFEDSPILNFFNAGEIDTFYNTLNRHHVAQIITNASLGVPAKTLIELLEKLGHSKVCTLNTITEFLKCGVIQSEQGTFEFFDENSTILQANLSTHYYLNNLIVKLVYIENMALVTPLLPKYYKRIKSWDLEDGDNGKEIFIKRINAAKALVQQIFDDEKSELNLIKNDEEKLKIYRQYNFGSLAATLAKNILIPLYKIKVSQQQREDRHGLSNSEWYDLIIPFKNLSKRKV